MHFKSHLSANFLGMLPRTFQITTPRVYLKAASTATPAVLCYVTSTVMAAPTALIQGASRGLGLEFCKHILESKTTVAVIATCRNPDGAAELRRVADQHPGRLTVLKLDVNREEDIRSAAERVKGSFGRLDLIVNSSAMLHPSGKGETSLRDVSAQVKHGVMTV